MTKETTIALSGEEALVLFELLSRLGEQPEDLVTVHEAERAVLWHMLASLENQLEEPLAPNYEEILARARDAVAPPDEGDAT